MPIRRAHWYGLLLLGLYGICSVLEAADTRAASEKPGSPLLNPAPEHEQNCRGPYTPIGHIQGPGDLSPCRDTTVTTRGVVTLVSTGKGALGGYFLQDPDGDNDPATSDGIFVFDRKNRTRVTEGDFIEIRAQVTEWKGLTELKPGNRTAVTLLSRDRKVTPTPVVLPETFDGELERYEGMLVSIAQPMTVTGNRWLDNLGQLKLASVDTHGRPGRLYQPTHLAPPGSRKARRIAIENARRFLVLDDGRNSRPNPLPFIGEPAANATVRTGDRVTDILGVLDFGRISLFKTGDHLYDYRVQVTQPPIIRSRNGREAAPPPTDPDLRIASFNVLNFFTQFGRTCQRPCGISGKIHCRGAKNDAELKRQKTKLAAALIPLHADIYAFQEVQNDGFSDASAIASLTELLGDDYDFIRTGDGHTGCDVISVGLAYGNTVRPIGTGLVLSGGPFGTSRAGASRAPLAQVFEHAATGERITVVVNHFKSRRAPQENTGDANSVNSKGQGYWNPRRTESAAHLAASLEELGGNIDPDIAIVGDFNAHAYEDPLRVLENAGYTNLLKPAAGQQPPAYTYVHAGLAGALDHVLVSNGLVDQAFAFTWPIDADEPDVMDYRLRGTGATWFHATPFRASDHDPVVLDITF